MSRQTSATSVRNDHVSPKPDAGRERVWHSERLGTLATWTLRLWPAAWSRVAAGQAVDRITSGGGRVGTAPAVVGESLHTERFRCWDTSSRPVTAEPARRRRSHGRTSRSQTSRRRYSLKERLSHYQRKWTTQRGAGHSPRLILAQGKRLWRMASDEQSAAIFCMSMRLRASNCSQRTVIRMPLCVEYGAKSSIRATMTPGARSSMGL